MWSEKLIELSEEYLNYDGTQVKHFKGKFGSLSIEDNIYKITLKPITNESQVLTFHSVDEMIKTGWAVD
ncbi:hypothetical protein FACS189445_2570 [Spirochaetia bacterium]|nr:hypothetical protein FACS189445_2570 [Spirochaetia bacterium]